MQTTILLTTHDLGDMEKLCSRIVIIDEGKLMYDGTLDDMTQRFGTKRSLMIEFEEIVDDFTVPNAQLVAVDDNKKTFSFDRTQTKPSQLIEYISNRYSVLDLQIIEPDIEDVVRSMYNDSKGD